MASFKRWHHYPQLRVEIGPDGKKVIHGLRLKTEEERLRKFNRRI